MTLIGTAILAELGPELQRLIDDRVTAALSTLQTAPPSAGWMTPPAAAKARGISVKRVRALITAGTVQSRQKVPGSDKLEINLASLDKALAGETQPQTTEPINAASWAANRASSRKAAP